VSRNTHFGIVAVTLTRIALPSTDAVVAVNPPVVATTNVLPLADGLAGDKGMLIISLPFSIFVSIELSFLDYCELFYESIFVKPEEFIVLILSPSIASIRHWTTSC